MKIVINPLDPKSIAVAQKMIEQYKTDFERKEKLFLERLAELGVTVARTGYSLASDYNEGSEITVSLQKTANGYSVIAAGRPVGFLEFGTGIRNREWDNSGMDYTPPPHGSYGQGKGKNPKGWWFYPHEGAAAVHTYGEMPVEAMRLARDEMVQNVIRIAREVWR